MESRVKEMVSFLKLVFPSKTINGLRLFIKRHSNSG